MSDALIGEALSMFRETAERLTLDPDAIERERGIILAEKRAEFEASHTTATNDDTSSDYPANATMCGKCSTKAVIVMDGCATCLSCGDSKCG